MRQELEKLFESISDDKLIVLLHCHPEPNFSDFLQRYGGEVMKLLKVFILQLENALERHSRAEDVSSVAALGEHLTRLGLAYGQMISVTLLASAALQAARDAQAGRLLTQQSVLAIVSVG